MTALCNNLPLDVILQQTGEKYYKEHYWGQQTELEYEW